MCLTIICRLTLNQTQTLLLLNIQPHIMSPRVRAALIITQLPDQPGLRFLQVGSFALSH